MYIYGKNVVKEVLQNKKNIKKAYVYKNFNDKEIINKLSNIDICYLEKYELDKNDGPNTLHGGFVRYEKVMWKAKVIEEDNYCGVKFSRLSPNGEQGVPGNVKLTVSYLLDKNNNLTCFYTAETDQATPINLTNHAYFNFAGNVSVENHTIQINYIKYLEVSP